MKRNDCAIHSVPQCKKAWIPLAKLAKENSHQHLTRYKTDHLTSKVRDKSSLYLGCQRLIIVNLLVKMYQHQDEIVSGMLGNCRNFHTKCSTNTVPQNTAPYVCMLCSVHSASVVDWWSIHYCTVLVWLAINNTPTCTNQ